jgi:hypothetical protein
MTDRQFIRRCRHSREQSDIENRHAKGITDHHAARRAYRLTSPRQHLTQRGGDLSAIRRGCHGRCRGGRWSGDLALRHEPAQDPARVIPHQRDIIDKDSLGFEESVFRHIVEGDVRHEGSWAEPVLLDIWLLGRGHSDKHVARGDSLDRARRPNDGDTGNAPQDPRCQGVSPAGVEVINENSRQVRVIPREQANVFPGEGPAAQDGHRLAGLWSQVAQADKGVRGCPQRAQVGGVSQQTGPGRFRVEEHSHASGPGEPDGGVADRRVDDFHAIDRSVAARYPTGHGDGPAIGSGLVAPFHVSLGGEHGISARVTPQYGLDEVERVEGSHASLDRGTIENAQLWLSH